MNELARRSDWRGLLAFSPDKPTSTEAQCNYYYAKLSVGQSQEARRGERAVADGQNQPGACEPLFSARRDSGQQDPLAYLERIRPAMKAGNIGLVKSLAQQMPANYQSIASAVVARLTIQTASSPSPAPPGRRTLPVRWPPSPSPASPAGTWKMPA